MLVTYSICHLFIHTTRCGGGFAAFWGRTRLQPAQPRATTSSRLICMLPGVLGSNLLQKFKFCKPLMSSMANSGSENVYILLAFRHSQVRFISPVSCKCKFTCQVRLPSVLLNFTSRSLFYDIDNSHGAAVQKCTDNAVYPQLLTQYWRYRKFETWR